MTGHSCSAVTWASVGLIRCAQCVSLSLSCTTTFFISRGIIMLPLLPTSLRLLLAGLLWASDEPQEKGSQLQFQLRHSHAITNTSRVIFANEPAGFNDEMFTIDTIPITTHRPPSFSAFSAARTRYTQANTLYLATLKMKR